MLVQLALIPAPDDPPLKSAPYQKELAEFREFLEGQGHLVGSIKDALLGMFGECPVPLTLLGDFTVKLAAIAGPALGTGIGAWLHAKYGRKVRLKIGDIEAEAQTREEVEKLLERAQEIQQRNLPKVIREP
jgi:hypothetical protein